MLLFWFNQIVSYLSIISFNLWWTLDSIMIPFSLLCSFNSWLVDATVLIQSDRKLPQHYFIQWTLNSTMIPFSLLRSFNSWLVDATVLIQSGGKLPQHYLMQWTLDSIMIPFSLLCSFNSWLVDATVWFIQPVSYLSIISYNLWWTLVSTMIPFSLLCSFNSWLVDATVLIQSDRKLPQHYFIQLMMNARLRHDPFLSVIFV